MRQVVLRSKSLRAPRAPCLPVARSRLSFLEKGHAFSMLAGSKRARLKIEVLVGEKIVEAYEADCWKKSWLLVELLYVANCATIIVSEEVSAGVVLAVSAEKMITGISLADPNVGLTIRSTRGKVTHIVGARQLCPLYSCFRLSASFFGSPELKPVRGRSDGTLPFERPTIDELLES